MNAAPCLLASKSRSLPRKHLGALARHSTPARLSPARSATRPSRASSTRVGAPVPDEKPQTSGVRSDASAITGNGTGTGSGTITNTMTTNRPPVAAGKKPGEPSPSASIILISPSNRILLLHRLAKSSAFPSAHVFPGGNLEPSDGHVPASGPARHMDNLAYRTGAIRELFEESGVLLARPSASSPRLLEIPSAERRRGRRAVHAQQVGFTQWLAGHSATATLDTAGLIPFTHWITPPNVPRRFTTQMYVYFVPLAEQGNDSVRAVADERETTAAEWMFARDWTRRARRGDIILFPPQYLLLQLCSQHLDLDLDPDNGVETMTPPDEREIARRRESLRTFIRTDGTPTWDRKYISPTGLSFGRPDGRAVLGLDLPGPELRGTELRGDAERVVLVRFQKEGPREVEVRWRREVVAEEEEARRARAAKGAGEGESGGGGAATPPGKEMADLAREKARAERAGGKL